MVKDQVNCNCIGAGHFISYGTFELHVYVGSCNNNEVATLQCVHCTEVSLGLEISENVIAQNTNISATKKMYNVFISFSVCLPVTRPLTGSSVGSLSLHGIQITRCAKRALQYNSLFRITCLHIHEVLAWKLVIYDKHFLARLHTIIRQYATMLVCILMSRWCGSKDPLRSSYNDYNDPSPWPCPHPSASQIADERHGFLLEWANLQQRQPRLRSCPL